MKTAVLVIDMQRGLFMEAPVPYEADEVVERINLVTKKAREAEIPVIYIQHEEAKGILAYTSKAWKLLEGLKVSESDIFVRKTTPNAFQETDLHEIASNVIGC